MPQNGPRGYDSLYTDMIPMDLQELAPECKIYTFLARCPSAHANVNPVTIDPALPHSDEQEKL